MKFTMQEIGRQGHNKRAPKGMVGRTVWMILIVVAVIVYFAFKSEDFFGSGTSKSTVRRNYYEPEPKEGKVYHKPNFALSYVEKYELPEWVSYQLTVEMLNQKKVERTQDFNPDPAITTGSGHYRDYKSSGYRRGHLVPAGDMSWNKAAMDATFLMSNIAPMEQAFNDGIWNELEQDVRDWARANQSVQVVTGPIFREPVSTIGDNEILVPRYFFKAVWTMQDSIPKVIGFLFDQTQSSFGELKDYVVPLDQIEKETGLDLFSNMYGDWEVEIKLEKQKADMGQWSFNDRWYQERIRNR